MSELREAAKKFSEEMGRLSLSKSGDKGDGGRSDLLVHFEHLMDCVDSYLEQRDAAEYITDKGERFVWSESNSQYELAGEADQRGTPFYLTQQRLKAAMNKIRLMQQVIDGIANALPLFINHPSVNAKAIQGMINEANAAQVSGDYDDRIDQLLVQIKNAFEPVAHHYTGMNKFDGLIAALGELAEIKASQGSE